MKKTILILTIAIMSININAQSFYDFKVTDINGEQFDFSTLKGKKVMVVNTASKCGYTPQYEGLQALYEKYKDQNFVIIGFPANDFLKQEPGTNSEIASFCKSNYGVTFPMMAKITVKGRKKHPLYKWLTKKKLNGHSNSRVKWNFQKYLIDENGNLIAVFPPSKKPMSDEIIKMIEN